MDRYSYKLKTLSSLIVSPRASLALNGFCAAQLDDKEEFLNKKGLRVIYPFYQYGEYKAYDPKGARYYLPGSSIKGALCGGGTAPGSIFVDDVPVENSRMVLRNLYKAQHLDDKKETPVFSVFFENVGVEMVRAGTEMTGELFLSGGNAQDLIRKANCSANKKIGQTMAYLRALIERKCPDKLCCVLWNLSALAERSDVILLGGYKGLLQSVELKNAAKTKEASAKDCGAIYVDPETCLPHGLVSMKLLI